MQHGDEMHYVRFTFPFDKKTEDEKHTYNTAEPKAILFIAIGGNHGSQYLRHVNHVGQAGTNKEEGEMEYMVNKMGVAWLS